METVFWKIVEMSAMTSVLILVVMALRLLLRGGARMDKRGSLGACGGQPPAAGANRERGQPGTPGESGWDGERHGRGKRCAGAFYNGGRASAGSRGARRDGGACASPTALDFRRLHAAFICADPWSAMEEKGQSCGASAGKYLAE